MTLRTNGLVALALITGCVSSSRQPVSTTGFAGHAGEAPADTSGASTVAEGWWRAFTLGDTAFLARHTSSRLTLSLSNGQALDREGMLRNASTHVPKPSTFVDPATDVVVLPTTDAVAVASRMREGSQGGANTYRYLSVLERQGSTWRMLAAHSTREIALTSRVPAQVAGPVADYVGSYRGQRGGIVRVVARDSVLALIEPGGAESRLEPIGPALFELPRLYDGIGMLRFAFARDSTGRVSSLSRLIYGSVVSWVRVP